MSKIKVGVAGYGVIGQRLADGVARQGDMELVGIADLAPTLSIRALKEKGMPYDLYLVDGADKSAFDACGIPVSGTFDLPDQQVSAETKTIDNKHDRNQPFRKAHDIMEGNCDRDSDSRDCKPVTNGNKPKVLIKTQGTGGQTDQ